MDGPFRGLSRNKLDLESSFAKSKLILVNVLVVPSSRSSSFEVTNGAESANIQAILVPIDHKSKQLAFEANI
ncbi:hypothetical protein CDAR_546961 [Caerostris darwini]|uniref:Uncharacterized protein n=1 Tax=Caerostris darwini TaxID=1538125 RepID=A0AAV4SU83_9ARAC|nr:hypothetical protein CDAR_546961 [Caerostris darwini]